MRTIQPGSRIAAASNAMAGRPEQAHKAPGPAAAAEPHATRIDSQARVGPVEERADKILRDTKKRIGGVAGLPECTIEARDFARRRQVEAGTNCMGSYGATGSAIANEGALARLIFNRRRDVHDWRSRGNSRSRFRPLHRWSVLRHDAGRPRCRGDPHREARGQRGSLVHPGGRRWRRRHVSPDGARTRPAAAVPATAAGRPRRRKRLPGRSTS